MLIRNMTPFLYNADSTEGTATDTQPNKTGQAEQTEKEKLLTQAEVDKLIGSTRKAARDTGKKELLEELGIDSPDTLKALLKAHKEREDAEKSESQKLAERLAALEKSNAEKDAKLAEAEKLRKLDKRDNALRALLSKAHDAQEVLDTLKATQGAKLDEFLNENGEFNAESATTFIADYQKQKPYLFKDERRGSGSNQDGRIPNPDKDRRKAQESKLSKITKGF